MKKVFENKGIRRIVKTLAVTAVISIGIYAFTLLLSWADRHDQKARLKQKECWHEIYQIIARSPKEKADWIKETVSVQRGLGGGVDYCNALELINNGDNHDEKENGRK
jgi:hypothetical protein